MLVLSRKPGEKILIGDQISVTVVRVGPNCVRLGIDAPHHLNIAREELCLDWECASQQSPLIEPSQKQL